MMLVMMMKGGGVDMLVVYQYMHDELSYHCAWHVDCLVWPGFLRLAAPASGCASASSQTHGPLHSLGMTWTMYYEGHWK
eukprot:11970956-Karenia_brevis.AAC.1